MPQKTPLYENHIKRNGKVIDFAGWLLPVQFKGIFEEHNSTRKSSGIFDIGHMGQIEVDDKEIEALERLTTNSIAKLAEGMGQYSFICNETGGIVDDLIIYRLKGKILVISNAVNAVAVFNKIREKVKSAKMFYGERTAIAFQGPDTIRIMSKISDQDVSNLKHRQIIEMELLGFKALVSRSGYSGEDGFEIFLDEKGAEPLWEALIKEGALPCGLGARDTLRIEAALPLYGHEINLEISPIGAGYLKAVDFSKSNFVGKETLLKQSKELVLKKLIGFEVLDRAMPRQGYKIFCDDKEAGKVTSGTFSPTFNKPIAMGYVDSSWLLAPGSLPAGRQGWLLEVRDKKYPINVLKLPFYRRCAKI